MFDLENDGFDLNGIPPPPLSSYNKNNENENADEQPHINVYRSATKSERNKNEPLLRSYVDDPSVAWVPPGVRVSEGQTHAFEAGIDEAGRGPLFGRVYVAAVVLPLADVSGDLDFSLLKDSKRFTSEIKIREVADMIRRNAVAWSVNYVDEKEIDRINILRATMNCMHRCVADIHHQLQMIVGHSRPNTLLVVDGNCFVDYTSADGHVIPHVCVEGGDNKYCMIAAASILAKVARDDYVAELCRMNPYLDIVYKIGSNKGYGAKAHLDGIRQYGISPWHRRSFGLCKTSRDIQSEEIKTVVGAQMLRMCWDAVNNVVGESASTSAPASTSASASACTKKKGGRKKKEPVQEKEIKDNNQDQDTDQTSLQS